MADAESPHSSVQNTASRFPIPILSHNHPISVKLNDDNYLIWRQQILATVRGYRLESYLTGEQHIPPQLVAVAGSDLMEINEEFLAWHSQDQLLSAWIQGSLSESAMVLVVGLESAKDIWKALETNFSSQSKAKVMQHKLKLQTMKKNGLPMTEYLNKMKSCCDLLGAAGCRILEQDQILHILSGLGQECDPLVVTVTSQNDTWTIQDVSALLLSFEARMVKAKHEVVNTEGSQPTANLAHASNQKRDYNPQNVRGGYFGGNEGARGGFGGRSARGGRGGRSSKIVCQLCFKPGHGADRCWYRYEQQHTSAQPHQGRQQHPISTYQPSLSANVAQLRMQQPQTLPPPTRSPSEYSFEGGSQMTSWYPDSGATNHLSSDLSNLNISSEYHGGNQLVLGNGSGVDISHVGESYIKSATHKTFLLKNLLHVPAITKNLLSVSQFAKDNDVFFEFHSTHCLVKDQVSKQVILEGSLDQGLYQFILPKSVKTSSSSFPAFNQSGHSLSACSASLGPSASNQVSSISLWHRRLGHPAFKIVEHV